MTDQTDTSYVIVGHDGLQSSDTPHDHPHGNMVDVRLLDGVVHYQTDAGLRRRDLPDRPRRRTGDRVGGWGGRDHVRAGGLDLGDWHGRQGQRLTPGVSPIVPAGRCQIDRRSKSPRRGRSHLERRLR